VRWGNPAASHVTALLVLGTCARRVDGRFHAVDGADRSNRVPCSAPSALIIGFGTHDG
jgi:hypothetical protein